MTKKKVRSKMPPMGISHGVSRSIQSGVVGWGGDGAGGGDSGLGGSSVVKAPAALQAL